MHSNTVALDSLLPPPSCLPSWTFFYFSFSFCLWSSQYPMYFWYFHSMKHLNCHSASFLNGVRRALPARSQREKGDQCVFTCRSAQPNQSTTWSKTVSPLAFKVCSALVDLIMCRWKHRWVKYPTCCLFARTAPYAVSSGLTPLIFALSSHYSDSASSGKPGPAAPSKNHCFRQQEGKGKTENSQTVFFILFIHKCIFKMHFCT